MILKKECPFFDEESDEESDDESDEEPAKIQRTVSPFFPSPREKPRPNEDIATKGDAIQVALKSLSGKTIKIDIGLDNTIDDLKMKVQVAEGLPISQQRIIYAGRQLEDERNLADYGIQNYATISLVTKLRGC